MIDINKKYRIKDGQEVFGLFKKNGRVYGWVEIDKVEQPLVWLQSDGALFQWTDDAFTQSEALSGKLDLIEVDIWEDAPNKLK